MKGNNLIEKVDIDKIADKGEEIYANVKSQYDPKDRGKYLAIDVDTKEVFFGKTSEEALKRAERKYPDKVFFLQRIGFDTAEAVACYYKLI